MTKQTKHAPATPLPWLPIEQVDCGYGRKSKAIGPLILDPSEGEYAPAVGDEDAAYIEHACNKYPRLVAELRAIVKPDSDARRIFDLLRELGEA